VQLRLRIERQRPAGVILGRDRRQLLASPGEEGALDAVVPLDRIEDANGPLSVHESVAQAANLGVVRRERPRAMPVGEAGHFAHWFLQEIHPRGTEDTEKTTKRTKEMPIACASLAFFLLSFLCLWGESSLVLVFRHAKSWSGSSRSFFFV